jgi:lysozyme family protein
VTADTLIDDIILREGGYVDHPADKGGPTKYGITRATLSRWRGHHVTAAAVQALTIEEARDIYVTWYIEQPGFIALAEPLRGQVVDFGVTSSPVQAVKTLQRVVGAKADGILGPRTRAAVEALNIHDVTRRYWQERVRFYAHIAALRPAQFVFLDGWLNRCFGMMPQ